MARDPNVGVAVPVPVALDPHVGRAGRDADDFDALGRRRCDYVNGLGRRVFRAASEEQQSKGHGHEASHGLAWQQKLDPLEREHGDALKLADFLLPASGPDEHCDAYRPRL
jgi:hypothetical protein